MLSVRARRRYERKVGWDAGGPKREGLYLVIWFEKETAVYDWLKFFVGGVGREREAERVRWWLCSCQNRFLKERKRERKGKEIDRGEMARTASEGVV